MSSPFPLAVDLPDFDVNAANAVVAMAESLGRTICIARSLIENGRVVDLTGLDRGVGLLCAKALDLPQEAGRTMRPYLSSLLAEADALSAVLDRYAEP